jgi:hypothetical protein
MPDITRIEEEAILQDLLGMTVDAQGPVVPAGVDPERLAGWRMVLERIPLPRVTAVEPRRVCFHDKGKDMDKTIITMVKNEVVDAWEPDYPGLTLERGEVEEVLGFSLDDVWGVSPEFMSIEKEGLFVDYLYWLTEIGFPAVLIVEAYQKWGGDEWIREFARYLDGQGPVVVDHFMLPPDSEKGAPEDFQKRVPGSLWHYMELRLPTEDALDNQIVGMRTYHPIERGITLRCGDRSKKRIIERHGRRQDRTIAGLIQNIEKEDCSKIVWSIKIGDLWIPQDEWRVMCIRVLRMLAQRIRDGAEERTTETQGLLTVRRQETGDTCIDKGIVYTEGGLQTGVSTYTDTVSKGGDVVLDEITQRKKERLQTLEVPPVKKKGKEEAYRRILSGKKAQQVVVFRVITGRTVYLNKEKRYMEFGGSVDGVSLRLPRISQTTIKVMGGGTIGLPNLQEWYIQKYESGGILVVPDSLFDKMVWMWEKDMMIWPHVIEAEGIDPSILPGFNGRPGNMCMGNIRLENYPQENIGHQTGKEQQRMARMVQELMVTDEGSTFGEMMVYVPWSSFSSKMVELRRKIKGFLGEENTQDNYSCIMMEVGRVLGALCSYRGGDKWCAVWQEVVYMEKSNSWWWYKETEIDSHPYGIAMPNKQSVTMEGIKRVLDKIGIVNYPVLGDMALKILEGKQLKEGRDSMYRMIRIWEAAYKGTCGVVHNRGEFLLVSNRESTDSMREGRIFSENKELRMKAWEEDGEPQRIVGETPILTSEETRIRRILGRDKIGGIEPPLCGVVDCVGTSCNPTSMYIAMSVV